MANGTYGLNEITAPMVSPPEALPTLIAHAEALAAVVPQVPVPIAPVATLKVVVGRTPFAVIEIGVGMPVMAQPLWPVALARHSRMNTESLGVNPDPDTLTVSPLVSPFDGVTTSVRFVLAMGVTLFDAPEGAPAPDLL